AQRPGRRPVDRRARIERLGDPLAAIGVGRGAAGARGVLGVAEAQQIAEADRGAAELGLARADARLVALVNPAGALERLAQRARAGLIGAAALSRARLVEHVAARRSALRTREISRRVDGAELGVAIGHRPEVGDRAGERADQVLIALAGLARRLPAVAAVVVVRCL